MNDGGYREKSITGCMFVYWEDCNVVAIKVYPSVKGKSLPLIKDPSLARMKYVLYSIVFYNERTKRWYDRH